MRCFVSHLKDNPSKIILFVGFFILFAVCVMNLKSDVLYRKSYLTFTNIITPAIDLFCMFFCVLTFLS